MAFRAMPFAFVGASALLAGASGCNQLFGLDPPRGVDAGGEVRDGPGAIDAAGDGRPPGMPAVVWSTNIDVSLPAGAVAGYEARAQFGVPDGCVLLAASGPCRAERCMALAQPLPAPESGTITIEGNLGLVDLEPGPDGVYPMATSATGGLYDPGITVGVYSTGGTVPAFSATLVAPAIVTFTAPALPSATAPATLTRSSDLDLSWTPGVPAMIVLVIADTVGNRTTCNVPGSAGAATLPSTVLRELAAGGGTFVAYTVVTEPLAVGAYDLSVVVAQAARRADNDWARGTITLQ